MIKYVDLKEFTVDHTLDSFPEEDFVDFKFTDSKNTTVTLKNYRFKNTIGEKP